MKKLIMDFYNLIKDLFSKTKVINRIKLPSQNLFYKDDFFIKIKKANKEDINEYETDFEKTDLSIVIQKVKNIVEKNIVLSNNYSFEDIKSIDIVFLFLEIVKFTRGKKVTVSFINNKNKIETIEFSTETFNYFKLNDSIMSKYDEKTKTFKINGYSYSLPSIGVENSLTMFLLFHSETDESYKYVNVDFDFTYFVSNKNFLTFKEIDNLIYIFNNDLDKEEKRKIKNIIREFTPLQKYSLIKGGKEIDINSKIDLEKIWK
jgi:hypothetical protein